MSRKRHPDLREWEEVQDLTLGEAEERDRWLISPHLLSENWRGHPLRGYLSTDLVPVLTYQSRDFESTVRPIGPVGNGIFFPEERKLSEFVADEPGEYLLDEDGVHPVGYWPNRGGRIRQFFCRIGLHRMRRIEGFDYNVKQCPCCLKVKISSWPLIGLHAPSETWGYIEMQERFVRKYDRKFPLPRGPVYTYPLDSVASNIQLSDGGRHLSFDL